MGKSSVAHRQTVSVRVDLDAAGAIEGEVFKHDVLQRADADAEVVVATEFEVGLIVELELADVGDAAQGDVADGAIERGAIVEAFHAGEDADGPDRGHAFGCSSNVFDDDALDSAVTGRVVLPFPGIERHVVIVRIATHAADDAIT